MDVLRVPGPTELTTIATPTPAPHAPSPASDRRMTRQTDRSTHAAISRTDSMESLIGSSLSASAPSSKGKGKSKEPSSPEKTPTASGSAPRPASKAESAAAGIRRLDVNHNALVARVDAGSTELHDGLNSLRAHIMTIATDVANANVAPASPALPAEVSNKLRDVIWSNNQSVSAITSLQGEILLLKRTLQAAESRLAHQGFALDDVHRRVDRLVDSFDPTVPDSSHAPLPLSNKRQRTSSDSSMLINTQPPLPLVNFPSAPTPAPAPASSYTGGGYGHHPLPTPSASTGPPFTMALPSGPMAPPSAPSLGPPAPTVQHSSNVSNSATMVEVGSVGWGKDITGEFKALLNLMPTLNHVSRKLRAHRLHPGYIRVAFNTNIDALSFITIWAAGPRPFGYDDVTAKMMGN